MVQVIIKRAAVDKYVIEEDDDEATEEGPENEVHCSLKGRWSITEAKGHHSELIMSMMSSKCSFRDIL